MSIRPMLHVVNKDHCRVPGFLDERGVSRPVLELRDTWGRFILRATKATVDDGGMPLMVCSCGRAKKPCPQPGR